MQIVIILGVITAIPELLSITHLLPTDQHCNCASAIVLKYCICEYFAGQLVSIWHQWNTFMSLLVDFTASETSLVAAIMKNVVTWDDPATSGMSYLYEIIRFVTC